MRRRRGLRRRRRHRPRRERGRPPTGLQDRSPRSSTTPLPVAAWQDLDVHGIRIIHTLTERIDRHVTPVGMNAELYRAGPYDRWCRGTT
ncbi:Wadjet anti-phage system protein JetD domain-containing protein [Streptomyces sp. NPDC002690]